jgi:hypothetical protein
MSNTEGANGSEPERAKQLASPPRYARVRASTDVTSEALRRWHESKGWDALADGPTRESDETVELPKNEG